MESTPTKTYTQETKLLLGHTAALLAFAKTQQHFGDQLALAIRAQNFVTSTRVIASTPSPYLIPAGEAEATHTAHWLLSQLTSPHTHHEVRSLLASYATTRRLPKNLVLGIVGLAIIGPTLGLIDSKKKKKNKAQLVFSSTYLQSLSAPELATAASQLSHELIGKELRLARGNAYALHPDTAEWCFTEPVTELYEATDNELATLHSTAEQDGLLTQTLHHNSRLVAVAISPSVNDEFAGDFSSKLST